MADRPTSRPSGAVFVQTNTDPNRVVVFDRADDGTLSMLDEFETGGAGDERPHLTSQGSVVLSEDGEYLLATNAASDDVGLFGVTGRGLELLGATPVGPRPKSVAERDGFAYVLCTAEPSVAGFRMTDQGLDPLDDAERSLSADADPAQVGVTPDGTTLVVTERGTDSIITCAVDDDARLGQIRDFPSSGSTPYGFAFTSAGVLVVTEAFGAERGEAAASSYIVRDGSLMPVSRSAHSGRSEACWAVVTPDDRYAFTTNFADGAVSCYEIDADGNLALRDATAGITEEGRPGLRDEDLTDDGRFLYAIDADAGKVFGWRVGGDGSLSPVGSWGDLPRTVAGLAAR